jgi:hypothetical protein
VQQVYTKVLRSDGGGIGDPYYVAGNYQQAAGTIGAVQMSETGQLKFETIDANNIPTWRAVANICNSPGNSAAAPMTVTLQPVPMV